MRSLLEYEIRQVRAVCGSAPGRHAWMVGSVCVLALRRLCWHMQVFSCDVVWVEGLRRRSVTSQYRQAGVGRPQVSSP
jgi:hypothetical protein